MIKYSIITAFSLGALVVAFAVGIAVGRWELPPFQQMWQAYRYFNPYVQSSVAEFTVDTAEISEGFEDVRQNAGALRDHLIDRVILPEDYVRFTSRDIADGKQELSAEFYGIKSTAFLMRTRQPDPDCLQVYIQGHGGEPIYFDYHNELVELSNQRGCDFLSMSMFGIGLNSGWMTFPTGKYRTQSSSLTGSRHGNIALYYDKDLPQVDPLALMLTAQYYMVRQIMDDYEDVTIMGISGGGWYVVWLAALIEDIDNAIVYAGSLPLAYRSTGAFFGDHEEYASPIYRTVDYWQLYLLGSLREDGRTDRNYYMVFNNLDPCCFMEPSASHFKGIAEQIYPDNVAVKIDENKQHAMRVPVIEEIWREIEERKDSRSQ